MFRGLYQKLSDFSIRSYNSFRYSWRRRIILDVCPEKDIEEVLSSEQVVEIYKSRGLEAKTGEDN